MTFPVKTASTANVSLTIKDNGHDKSLLEMSMSTLSSNHSVTSAGMDGEAKRKVNEFKLHPG